MFIYMHLIVVDTRPIMNQYMVLCTMLLSKFHIKFHAVPLLRMSNKYHSIHYIMPLHIITKIK